MLKIFFLEEKFVILLNLLTRQKNEEIRLHVDVVHPISLLLIIYSFYLFNVMMLLVYIKSFFKFSKFLLISFNMPNLSFFFFLPLKTAELH